MYKAAARSAGRSKRYSIAWNSPTAQSGGPKSKKKGKKRKKKPSAANGSRSRVKLNARRRKKPNKVSGKPKSVNPKKKSKPPKPKPVGKIPLKRIGASSSGITEEGIQDLKPGHEKEIKSCGETEITKGRFCLKCNKSTFFINHRQEKILINGRSEICHVADCKSCGHTRPIRAI